MQSGSIKIAVFWTTKSTRNNSNETGYNEHDKKLYETFSIEHLKNLNKF